MKILLVGLGQWGSKHLRVWQSLPVELFCCDENDARRRGAARFSTHYRDFLPEVDAAVIVTQVSSHYELARECLEAGKDVFVEKPLAATSQQCRELAERAAAAGRILQTGHIFRFDPATRWLGQALRAGRFGAVRLLRGRFAGFKRPRPDGGSMLSDAIHFVDLFNFLLDTTPRRVQAIQHDFLGRGMDDVSLLSLEYGAADGPVWATVETDYFAPGKHREVTVVGNCLSAVCDYTAAPCQIKTHENHHTRSGSVAGAVTPIETPGAEPLLAELQSFLECVATRGQPLADGWAGYHALRTLEAAALSAQTGKSIDIS